MRALLCLLLVGCGVETSFDEEAPATATNEDAIRCRKLSPFSPDTTDDWRWTKLGRVRGLPAAANAGDGALSPALLATVDGLHLWYAQKVGLKHTLHHAISNDAGASFHDLAPVEGLGDDYVTAYPTVWSEGSQMKLLYGSGSFSIASSDDGVHFTPEQKRVLTASYDPQRFDAFSVIYPSRFQNQLFFSGFDGRRIRIGRAVVQPDGSFAVEPQTPVIDIGAAERFDNTAVAQPQVRRALDRLVMFYGGYDTSKSNPGPYRIGFAESEDGITWIKRDVAIPLGARGDDAWSTRDPALVALDGRWLMIYVGLGDDNRYRLMRAGTDVCGL